MNHFMNMDITYRPYIEKVEVDNVASLKDWKKNKRPTKGLAEKFRDRNYRLRKLFLIWWETIGKCMAISFVGPIN